MRNQVQHSVGKLVLGITALVCWEGEDAHWVWGPGHTAETHTWPKYLHALAFNFHLPHSVKEL